MNYLRKLADLSFWLIPIAMWLMCGWFIAEPITTLRITPGFKDFTVVVWIIINMVLTVVAVIESMNF